MIVKPLHPSIGASITDCNLTSLSATQIRHIRQVLLDHQVIFFPEQDLSYEDHIKLASALGPLAEPHPFFPHVEHYPHISVLEVYPGHPPGETFWHTDATWLVAPVMGAVLYSRVIPPRGGDTIWLSMQKVWQDLDKDLQDCLKPLRAVHALHAFRGSRFDKANDDGLSTVQRYEQQADIITHPMVAEHPETGKATLFINEQYTRSIVGWADRESDALLQTLFKQARESHHQYRHQWSANTVAIWDNRCTQHYAVTDYGEQHRVMHRVCIAGQPLKQAFDVLG